jgi:diguanylate cyclase (GGDEF)-like protein
MTWIESSTNLLNIALSLVILCLGIRIVASMRFTLQRGSVRLFIAAAALFAVKELVISLGDRQSILLHDFCEVLETGFIGCLCMAMFLIVRSENLEINALHQQANQDRLTGLMNLAAFTLVANQRIKLARDNGLPLALFMLDIDSFKQYNDTYGHEAGNIALQCVAHTLRTTARENDLIARYGGEEFVLLLFTSPEAALPAAERLRAAIEARCSPGCNPSLQRQLTASIGVTRQVLSNSTIQELIEVADREMYQAKQTGRNRVCIAMDEGTRLQTPALDTALKHKTPS